MFQHSLLTFGHSIQSPKLLSIVRLTRFSLGRNGTMDPIWVGGGRELVSSVVYWYGQNLTYILSVCVKYVKFSLYVYGYLYESKLGQNHGWLGHDSQIGTVPVKLVYLVTFSLIYLKWDEKRSIVYFALLQSNMQKTTKCFKLSTQCWLVKLWLETLLLAIRRIFLVSHKQAPISTVHLQLFFFFHFNVV